jgi:hypothetical protein
MEKINFTYYKFGKRFIGWMDDYPQYRTQGADLDQLKGNLEDISDCIKNGDIKSIHPISSMRKA